jgi:RNA polymerase sigma factor (sigma-70 family)
MGSGHSDTTIRRLRTLFSMGAVGQLTDGQLLKRFTTGPREAAESAFAAMVERHGPMVLRVCQSALGDAHDAQDAFQATFLVLVRRAGAVRDHDSVGSWLHGVALRVAAKAKAEAARRRTHERRGAERASVRGGGDEDRDDLRPVLHTEVGRLPEKYRAPIVLCYLEGLTHEQAAQQLGWPVGTVRGRLARARDLLRARLTRRGLALPVGLLAAGLSTQAVSAAMPAALRDSTIQAAMRFAAGKAMTTGVVPAAVVALAEGGQRTMFLTKLKAAAAVVLVPGLFVAGAGVLAQQGPNVAQPASPEVAARAEGTIHDQQPPTEAELDRLVGDAWVLRDWGDFRGLRAAHKALKPLIQARREALRAGGAPPAELQRFAEKYRRQMDGMQAALEAEANRKFQGASSTVVPVNADHLRREIQNLTERVEKQPAPGPVEAEFLRMLIQNLTERVKEQRAQLEDQKATLQRAEAALQRAQAALNDSER